jgi:formylglycine-generating enzyme required for sulfatase activity
LWQAKPESRHLPAWWEWANIRLLTRKKDWTPPQRQMMRRARNYHAVVGAALLVGLLLVSGGSYAVYGWLRAEALVGSIVTAEAGDVPPLVKQLAEYRQWANPRLLQHLQGSREDSKEHLHASLALLPVDEGQVEYLYGRLLQAGPLELPVIRDALTCHRDAVAGRLWGVLEDGQADRDRRFRAACTLATYDVTQDETNRKRWDAVSPFVADRLLVAVQQNPSQYDPLLKTLGPAQDRLLSPLAEVFRSRERSDGDHSWAASFLAEYTGDRPDVLAGLLLDANDKQFAVLWPKAEGQRQQVVPICKNTLDTPLGTQEADEEKERLGKRQANAAVVLLRLDRADKVWPLLQRHPPDDPRARSYLIHRLSPLGADPRAIIKQLNVEKDVSVRRALLLSLGEFTGEQLPPAEREPLLSEVAWLYREEPDAGLHGAAEWLLRQWGQAATLKGVGEGWKKDRQHREEQIRQQLAKEQGRGEASWYVNGQGQTMVVIHGPVEFLMGSPSTEAEREGGPEGQLEVQHKKRIGRSFAVASKEVTVEQFLRFRNDHFYNKQYSPTADCPVTLVTWYDAAAYCNWLSEQEGIPKDQWVYLPNDAKQFAGGMRVRPNYLALTGYRLPSEAEWEYACRAGAVTSRYYGETEELLGRYAWYSRNALDRGMLPGPPGRWGVRGDCLKPNDLGLFDMLGNAHEWCQEHPALYSPEPAGRASEDREDKEEIPDDRNRELRGGGFDALGTYQRSARRNQNRPSYSFDMVGLRPARTYR